MNIELVEGLELRSLRISLDILNHLYDEDHDYHYRHRYEYCPYGNEFRVIYRTTYPCGCHPAKGVELTFPLKTLMLTDEELDDYVKNTKHEVREYDIY